MNFLNPAFLVSLAAVALPLIVHFFSRRRVPKVPFSSLRFLRSSQRRSMKRINFRRLLLLVLRMAAVALVALAFARPVIEGALVPGSAPVASCIIIDRSYSMGLESEQGTLLERSRDIAERIIREAGDNDRLILAALDTEVENVFDMEGRGSGFALEELARIEPSWKSANIEKGIRKGIDLLDRSGYNVKELYLISDFRARKGDGTAGSEKEEEKIPGSSDRAIYMIPVREIVSGNLSLLDIRTPGTAIHAGEAVTITATFYNGSESMIEAAPVSVSLEGEELINRELRLGPGEMTEEEFSFPVEEEGWLRGEVALGNDRLLYDNSRLFVIHAIDRADVLLAGVDQFYLEKAIDPGSDEGDINLQVRPPLSITSSDIRGADVVVLGSGPELWDEDIELLRSYIEEGGGAVIFVREGLAETAGKISRFNPQILPEEREGTLENMEKVPDLLRPFSPGEFRNLSRIRFIFKPLAAEIPSSAVVMRFKDRTPFIWRERKGMGKVIFINCLPEAEGTELVLSPYFLPIIQQAIFSTAAGGLPGGETIIGEQAEWRAGRLLEPEVYFESAAAGGDIIKLEYRSETGGITVSPAEKPGILTLISDGETARRAAVNPDCMLESRMKYIDPGAFADSLGIEDVVVIEEGEEVSDRINRARYGREITGALIVAAIAILVIELIVAQNGMKRWRKDVEQA